MDFEGALRARLLAAAPITSLVAQRVYWEERPQGSLLPAIVLHNIVDERDQHMGGFQSVRDALVQADAMGLSFADKKAVKEAIITTLAPAETSNGIKFQPVTNVSGRPQNERTETQYVYRDIIEMKIHYSNA